MASSRNTREIPAHILGPRILLLITVLALLLIGFVMVYSASTVEALSDGKDPASFLFDQLKFAAIGVVCAVVLWKFIPYGVWKGPFVWLIWIIAIALLVLTAVMGTEELGAQRWISLGPISLQPSEFAKIAFVLMGARILDDYRQGELSTRDMFVQAALLILIPILFLYQTQSDLGTTLICFVGILAVMWVGEVPLRVILIILGVGIVFAVFATVLTGYRSDRFVYLDPWNDGEGGYGTGYQIIHSFYAFSEGGLFGVGIGNSREKFLYLPEAETDFIFAIIGEELGLVGAFAVIALFMLLLYAGMHIARSAPDNFGAMIAGSCIIMIVFQAFLNIGCVIGILPTTGKPLPFISSGGSSLIATLIMVGLVLSVSKGADAPTIYDRRREDLRVVRTTQGRSRR
ncbi:putative lipid II flippase FtsW [Eggerthella sp. YY7918]|uniref:putative lipid II flippase FtsW n=1 Tax=Eggerthella sp. (strain YY7918) TaxID=502558 RepID=UPI00021711BE|nr:putative lipid II flippase FtsW [Eggerthella sp. YY7918]BAK44145.1 bacterial cell division membrane protein [Eggerthella sp. YY7918]